MTNSFSGFDGSRKRLIGVPDQFFSEILSCIQDINELKVILYILWFTYTQGDFGAAITLEDVLEDKKFLEGYLNESAFDETLLRAPLEKAVEDKVLIKYTDEKRKQIFYFINCPRGRAALKLMKNGHPLFDESHPKTTLDIVKSNIFKLYEENIGPLTPIIADELRDAQDTFPEEWIHEAMQIAVKNNVRRWKYVISILSRWQKDGRNGTDRRDTQEDYQRYVKGEYGDIGKHW